MIWINVFMASALILFSNVVYHNSALATEDDLLCGRYHNHVSDHGIHHKPRADIHYNNFYRELNDPVKIPLTIDLAERANIDLPIGTQLEAPIAMIEIYNDGRILYDGKDISSLIKSGCKKDDSTSENSEYGEQKTKNSDFTHTQ